MNKLRVELYNRLTDIDGIENMENFLCSIDFKPTNGNMLLNALEKIQNIGYSFSIIKGFIDECFELDNEYNSFKKCIIRFENDIDINKFKDLLKDISIEYINEKTFELKIKE